MTNAGGRVPAFVPERRPVLQEERNPKVETLGQLFAFPPKLPCRSRAEVRRELHAALLAEQEQFGDEPPGTEEDRAYFASFSAVHEELQTAIEEMDSLPTEKLPYIERAWRELMAIPRRAEDAEEIGVEDRIAMQDAILRFLIKKFPMEEVEMFPKAVDALADAPGFASLPTFVDALGSMAPPDARLATRIPTLDRVSRGGFAGGRVYTFLGPPGAAKTAMLCQLAVTFAKWENALVIGLFFDEGAWQAAMMMTEQLGFDRETLENDFESIRPEVQERAENLNVLLPDPGDPETALDRVRGWLCGVVRYKNQPIVLIIDSVQTARVTPKEPSGGSRKERADAVMSWARGLAAEFGAVVLLASKANRASWSHKDTRDNTDPLSGGLDSSEIEFASDALFFMEKDGGRLVVLKNRPGDGSKPTIALRFDRERASLTEIDETAAEEEAAEATATRLAAQVEKVARLLKKHPDGLSGRAIKDRVGGRGELTDEALDSLEKSGRAVWTLKGRAHLWTVL
jgi:hypothetical protein